MPAGQYLFPVQRQETLVVDSLDIIVLSFVTWNFASLQVPVGLAERIGLKGGRT